MVVKRAPLPEESQNNEPVKEKKLDARFVFAIKFKMSMAKNSNKMLL